MELLIAGGIALAGYRMAGPGSGPGPKHRPDPDDFIDDDFPSDDDASDAGSDAGAPRDLWGAGDERIPRLQRRYATRAAAAWEEARDAGVSGVVVPGLHRLRSDVAGDPRNAGGTLGGQQTARPFMTVGARSQHSSGYYKTAMLEGMTGALDMSTSGTGTYRHKREVAPLFPPSQNAAQLTGGGTQGNGQAPRDLSRFVPSKFQSGVIPVEQVRVGRGVGVGPDVLAAGGFHPMVRIMPENVGAYKLNPLEARATQGNSRISKGPLKCAKVAINRNPDAAAYPLERRPPMPSGVAARTAPTPDPEFTRGHGRVKPLETDRFGNPGTTGAQPMRPGGQTRGGGCGGDDPDRNHTLPAMINLGEARHGVGAYTYTGKHYDMSQYERQQREAHGREGFLTGPRAPTQYDQMQFDLPATQRGAAYSRGVGGVGAVAAGGAVRPGQPLGSRTLREVTREDVMVVGVRAPNQAGPMENINRAKRMSRNTKRGPTARAFYSPMTGGINTPLGRGVTTAKAKAMAPAYVAPTTRNPLGAGVESRGVRARPSNKLASSTERDGDLGLIADQLRGNPLAVNIADASHGNGGRALAQGGGRVGAYGGSLAAARDAACVETARQRACVAAAAET